VVSMVAFQAVDPGSIPGHRIGSMISKQVFVFPIKLPLIALDTWLHPGCPAWEAKKSTVYSIIAVLATQRFVHESILSRQLLFTKITPQKK
jgi:hypothetical protein